MKYIFVTGGVISSLGKGLTAAALGALLQSGPTNAHPERGTGIEFPLARYRTLFATLPPKIQSEVTARWGDPASDPFVRGENFHLPALRFGNLAVLLQPARGYDLDETAAYHDPDLVPPHGYLAAYLWLRRAFAAHAVIHNGKHGNLEWLPGKANALSADCLPEVALGPMPQLYPFIVNDPGEGSQAKRRTGAVIIDHLTPPLTRAETHAIADQAKRSTATRRPAATCGATNACAARSAASMSCGCEAARCWILPSSPLA